MWVMLRVALEKAGHRLRKKSARVTRRALSRLVGREIVHFLHIGKTGGTAIKYALSPYVKTKRFLIELHGHGANLRKVPKGQKVFFILRDPTSRFVSAFRSGQKMGQPRYNVSWSPEEEAAFKRFDTPNELAKALSSENEEIRQAAVNAMRNIAHVNSSFWDWFENKEYFLSRLSDIFFIGFQESLDDDFEILREKLGLPEDLKLTRDEIKAHKTPLGLDNSLDQQAIRNLKQWYADDYEFIQICRNAMSQVSSRPSH